MKAENDRTIRNWYEEIKRGDLAMPRYQRGKDSWGVKRIERALFTLLSPEEPIGILLISPQPEDQLENALRHFEDTQPEGTIDLLLDGQQRMQALWNSLNKLGNREYFVLIVRNGNAFLNEKVVSLQKGKDAEGRATVPVSKNRRKRLEKKAEIEHDNREAIIIPFDWLKNDISHEVCKRWLDSTDDGKASQFKDHISKTQDDFWEKVVPYFNLKQYSKTAEQIRIFITVNRSSVNLTQFELTVANIEKKIGESLLDFADDLKNKVSKIEDLEKTTPAGDYRELILKAGCLIQESDDGPFPPKKSYYMQLDYGALFKQKTKIISSIESAVNYLENEFAIGNRKVLPSVVPLRVLSALYFHDKIPRSSKGTRIAPVIKQYVWRAFLTERYQGQANDKLMQDYISIKKYAETETMPFANLKKKDIFSIELPSKLKLEKIGWPTSSGILAKGIILLASQEGARDLYDTNKTILLRTDDLHHHHIFPKKKVKGKFPDDKEAKSLYDRVLNCMISLEETNWEWGEKWPSDALEDIVGKKIKSSGMSPAQAIKDLNKALQTHGLSYEMFEGCGSNELDAMTPEEFEARYDKFLQARAELIHAKMKEVCND